MGVSLKHKSHIKDKVILNVFSEIEGSYNKWLAHESDIIQAVRNENFSGASPLINEAKETLDGIIKLLHLINNRIEILAKASSNSAQESINRGIVISLIILAVLGIIAVLVSFLISRNISRSLSFFKEIFKKGASGDLEAKYPVKSKSKKGDEINELGIFFNSFMDNVRGVITEVIDVSNDLGASSEELSVTISNFSENSQSQAAASEEVTATMEEISAGVDNVSDNSESQNSKLNEFIFLMKDLSAIIGSMAEKIRETQSMSMTIAEQARAGNESLNLMDMIMNKITESSNKVSEIVDIIDNISDKINLLSLNAAIEAARAGEAGRGFAVVADEISKLADQTASSISDIGSLIQANKDDITQGITNVTDTVGNIGRVIDGVESINSMMSSIYSDMEKQESANKGVNENAEELRTRSEEIKSASEEQKIAVTEIMKSISSINDLIQGSAAGSEEMTANANKLASMAEHLLDRIKFFTTKSKSA
ncbi:MAG: methyl-accepting chemotaxis protein [Spirochaetes bacterium]|nr:methyl-accepting chemotaxis protein [Spirochaetota bacterium]